MIKVVAVIKAKPELTREEFLHFWNVEHPAYVRKLPGILKYRQNPAIEHRKPWPYSGMAELWFDSVADVKVAYEGPEGKTTSTTSWRVSSGFWPKKSTCP